MEKINITEILGVRVNLETHKSAIDKIEAHMNRDTRGSFITLMASNNVIIAQEDPTFKKISNQTFLSLPDGTPLVWLARARGYKKINKCIRGADFMFNLFKNTYTKSYKHFFYGGREGIADQLKSVFEKRFPGVNIVGTFCPPFRKLTPEEDIAVCKRINDSKADIVWVGLSTPKQEYWMHEHLNKINASLMIGVGAAFDFHTGNAKEAPKWIQGSGFEWLFRLCNEPRRLWKRYLIGNSKLIYWMIKETLTKKERR